MYQGAGCVSVTPGWAAVAPEPKASLGTTHISSLAEEFFASNSWSCGSNLTGFLRYGVPVTLSESTHNHVERSSKLLEVALARGDCLYGKPPSPTNNRSTNDVPQVSTLALVEMQIREPTTLRIFSMA